MNIMPDEMVGNAAFCPLYVNVLVIGVMVSTAGWITRGARIHLAEMYEHRSRGRCGSFLTASCRAHPSTSTGRTVVYVAVIMSLCSVHSKLRLDTQLGSNFLLLFDANYRGITGVMDILNRV